MLLLMLLISLNNQFYVQKKGGRYKSFKSKVLLIKGMVDTKHMYTYDIAVKVRILHSYKIVFNILMHGNSSKGRLGKVTTTRSTSALNLILS